MRFTRHLARSFSAASAAATVCLVHSYCSNSPSSQQSSHRVGTAEGATLPRSGSVEIVQLAALRPPTSDFLKIDSILLENDDFVKAHALHEALAGEGRVEAYEVYKNKMSNDLYCVIQFGNEINGHKGIVHGGITALLFDNTFGWVFFARGMAVGVTANLSVNFRSEC
jgi:hypothetical protein